MLHCMRITYLAIAALLAISGGQVVHAQGRVAPKAKKAKKVVKKPAAKAPRRVAAKAAKGTKGAALKAKGLMTPKAIVERTKKLAAEYTKENKLGTPRIIKMGPTGRKVERVFVPILQESQQAFQKKYAVSGGNQTVIVRHTPQNAHVAMIAEPGDVLLWGLNYNGKPGNKNDLTHLYAQKDGTRSTWAGSSIVVHPTDVKSLTTYLAANKKRNTNCEGHCMVWLPSAPTGGKGETLFTDMGIKRSKEGNNIKAKMVHSGNHRVGVVGIHVTSLKQFKDMTDAELQGPPPAKGVDQAAIK